MKLVIIAGGKGTRLGLTDIPKPMVKLDGLPLLQHQINLAKRYGITDIFILSGHLSNVIFDYFKNGADFGVKITHIIEPYPLGTAGCIKLLEYLIDDRFIVFYGDVVMDIDLNHFIKFDGKQDSVATALVHPNDHPFDSDLLETDSQNRVIAVHPKPHWETFLYKNIVNAAVYILSPTIFKYLHFQGPSDFGKDVFPLLLKKNQKIAAYKSSEYVKDMGTLDRLAKVNEDFITGKVARLNCSHKRKAIFLDRDGVINKEVDNLSQIEDFELLNGVAEAIRKLNQSEYLSIVVTNQPVIAKGFITEPDLNQIHKKMETLLGNSQAYLDEIYYCPHHPESGFAGEIKELKVRCNCRKPEPGMILKAANDYNIDLEDSWMIGDRGTDVLAGKRAGCKTVYLNPDLINQAQADFVFAGLLEAVNFILESHGE